MKKKELVKEKKGPGKPEERGIGPEMRNCNPPVLGRETKSRREENKSHRKKTRKNCRRPLEEKGGTTVQKQTKNPWEV